MYVTRKTIEFFSWSNAGAAGHCRNSGALSYAPTLFSRARYWIQQPSAGGVFLPFVTAVALAAQPWLRSSITEFSGGEMLKIRKFGFFPPSFS